MSTDYAASYEHWLSANPNGTATEYNKMLQETFGQGAVDRSNQALRGTNIGPPGSQDIPVQEYMPGQGGGQTREQMGLGQNVGQPSYGQDMSLFGGGGGGIGEYDADRSYKMNMGMAKNDWIASNYAGGWQDHVAAGSPEITQDMYQPFWKERQFGARQEQAPGAPPGAPPTPQAGGAPPPQTSGTMTAPPPTSTGVEAAADMPPPTPGPSGTQMTPAQSAAAKTTAAPAAGGTAVNGQAQQVDINIKDETDNPPPTAPTDPMPQMSGIWQGTEGPQPQMQQMQRMNPMIQNQQMAQPQMATQSGGQAPYPQPQPPVTQGGPNSPWGANPAPVAPATPPTNPGNGMGNADMNPTDPWRQRQNPEDNFYGPQQIAGATPSPADYNSVQGYADQANQASRRYLDPQQQMQNDRLDQELINKGVDPNSPQGRTMANQLAMQQTDANNAASFGALQFGQGVQNQMSQQQLANQGLAANMQNNLWNYNLGQSGQELSRYQGDQSAATQKYLGDQGLAASKYGQDQQFALGKSGQDLQRYGLDMGNQLAQGQLDMSRQGQNFNQMMGLEGVDFRNRAYNDQQQWNYDQMTMAMMGQTPVPNAVASNPAGAAAGTASQGYPGLFSGGVSFT